MYGLSSFFIGEQKVADELGPIMRAARPRRSGSSSAPRSPTRPATSASSTASSARSACSRAPTSSPQRLEALDQHINDAFRTLFDDLLKSRVDRLAQEPEDRDALVEAITLYHMVIEGMLALTGQHFIIDYNERIGTLPGFVEGFSNVARDEHRHIAFGVRFLTDCVREDDRYRRRHPEDARAVAAGRRRRDRSALARGGGQRPLRGRAARRPTPSRRSASPAA